MPNVLMLRPGDGNETAGAYKAAVLNTKGKNPENRIRPSILALSRQNLPNLPGTSIDGCLKGGYIVHGGDGKPDAIVLATGEPRACVCRSLAEAYPSESIRIVG